MLEGTPFKYTNESTSRAFTKYDWDDHFVFMVDAIIDSNKFEHLSNIKLFLWFSVDFP